MIEQAVDVAQLVVDVVKEIISIVLAGLTLASVPIYGQVQLVDKVRDAVRLANDARKVLTVFWNFLLVVKDSFVLAADCFTAEALAPAPGRLVGADDRAQRCPRRAARGRGRSAWPSTRRVPADVRTSTAGLQRQALSGALGADMRTLAERVRAGSTTWAEVFDGTSPDVDLARGHVGRMAEAHGPQLRRQVR